MINSIIILIFANKIGEDRFKNGLKMTKKTRLKRRVMYCKAYRFNPPKLAPLTNNRSMLFRTEGSGIKGGA